MPGERCGDQHPWLRRVDVLGEVQELAEGQVERDPLGDRHVAVADPDRRDVEAGTRVAEMEAGEHLEAGIDGATGGTGEGAGHRAGPACAAAQRLKEVVVPLVGLVKNSFLRPWT